jgi:hypothetical protein
MTSKALTNWQTDRAIRLDRLEVAHRAVGGRLLAGGLSRALVLQLTAEFQGFARELHDEASLALATALAQGDPDRRRRLRAPYLHARRLDRGNAGPHALDEDFRLFGIKLWDQLRRRHPTRARHWHDRLALLTEARNGLAHADGPKVARVEAAGRGITLGSARRWRSTLDGLAVAMDRVVGEEFHRELGIRPW